MLPLCSWRRALRLPLAQSVQVVPRPESPAKRPRKLCFEPPPKWSGPQRPKLKPRASRDPYLHPGEDRKSVFDVGYRKVRLKSAGKELPETKRISLDSTREVEMASSFQESQDDQRTKLWELHRLAREVNMKVEEVVSIKSIFDACDDGNGTLDIGEFQHVATEIIASQLGNTTQARERVLQLCERSFAMIDSDGSGTVDFEEFIRWYASRSFSTSLLLTDAERGMRELAKRCGVNANTLDKVKEYFDAVDTDGSGNIQFEEFSVVLPRMLQLPCGFELPESRIRYFWSEADSNHDDKIVFSEFLVWWCKYLTKETNVEEFLNMQNAQIVNNFYRSMRHIGKMRFDPPPQPARTEEKPPDPRPRSESIFSGSS